MTQTLYYSQILAEYLPILIFAIIAFTLSITLIVIASMRSKNEPNEAKLSPYECGFEPLQKQRFKINSQFYLVGLLFVIFDVEIAFLFPWAITIKQQYPLGFWSMIIFLVILGVGFIYEWKKGALNWT